MATQRIQMSAVVPDGYRAVLGLERYVKGRIDHELLELVKLRASMLNNCAFCVDMHATAAAAAGEEPRRLFALAAWRESPFFSEGERIALDLTDAVTRLDEHGVPDDVWDAAVKQFGEEGAADLVLAIATINVWNRISIAARTALPPLA
jgi:AhpD family alkylhydroperoxidase